MRFSPSLALLLASGLFASALSAAEPRFTHLSPQAGQRGTEVNVALYGQNLEDAEELLIYDSGMEVTKFEVDKPEDPKRQGRQVNVTLKIAKDCPLGAQRMRIRTRTGLSDLMNFHVGPLPVVAEKEPNTDFEAPQAVSMNTSIEGRIDREDVDYFVIEAKKGERISAEVFGVRLGRSSGTNYFDPYLAILDEERFELAISDDAPLVWNDAALSVIAPKDGKYIVQIRDAAYNGDGRAYYILHVGNFPRPIAVTPAGGRPGETLKVTFLGDAAGPITREITLPKEAPKERFGIPVEDEKGIAPSNQPFRVVDLENVMEQEPNNSLAQATAGPAPGAFNGIISEDGDIDFFKFTAKKGQKISVDVIAREIRTGLDPVLVVYQLPQGKSLGSSDDVSGKPDPTVNFTAPEDGEYGIAVRDHLTKGAPTYVYRVEVSHQSPTLYAEPIEFARYKQHQIIIPQGGGSGIVANIQRREFGGPVNFRSDNLPKGVRIECPESWRSDGTASVVFYADEDAPLGGHFTAIEVFLDDPKQADRKISGPVRQDILMVRGRNNNRVWEERMFRLPIVVVEKAPFKCWIEVPKVPIVRGGSTNLVVKCEKAEGWDEDILLTMLQNPPGVSSNGSAKIPKGQTQGLMAVNASGNAAIRETMVSIRCRARNGNGTYEVCTPFAPLNVKERYMTMEFAQGAVEQGKEIPYLVTVNKREDFEGEAEVELLGLPANATAEKLKMTKETKELTFQVKAAENTPVGMSKNVFCRVIVPENGGTIIHNLGSGRLRVDKPAPPPKEPSKEKPKEEKPVAKAEKPPKPLSRLEQLRLEQEKRAAGGE